MLATIALAGAAASCTKDQICFPDFQECPGEETGGEEVQTGQCLVNDPALASARPITCFVEELSIVEMLSIQLYLSEPYLFDGVPELGDEQFHGWSEDTCGVTLFKYQAWLGNPESYWVQRCWPSSRDDDPPYSAWSELGPVGMTEYIDGLEVVRVLGGDWLDAALMHSGAWPTPDDPLPHVPTQGMCCRKYEGTWGCVDWPEPDLEENCNPLNEVYVTWAWCPDNMKAKSSCGGWSTWLGSDEWEQEVLYPKCCEPL